MFCLRIYDVCGRPLLLCIFQNKISCQHRACTFLISNHFFSCLQRTSSYLYNCDIGYMFFVPVSTLNNVDFWKKKIKCVAGLNNCFFLVLSSGLICTFVILTQVFFAFTTHLYYSDVAPIFFCACWPVLL